MLEVKVNICPGGNHKERQELKTIEIINSGNGVYHYNISGDVKGVIKNFDHKNGALGLLKMVLNDCDQIKQNKTPTKSDLAKKYNISEDSIQPRSDGRVEWFCEHGVGHPIYVPENLGSWGWVHGCDGCCRKLFNGG